MIPRHLAPRLKKALAEMPVVALLGPRQVGKTTLALALAEGFGKKTGYLDLELDSDRAKLRDAEAYLRRFDERLLIIDEVQRQPDLFRILRGLVDARKRAGEKAGQFLLLGSASRDLIQQSSETLAGRIRFMELCPFTVLELFGAGQAGFNLESLWTRGGFPDSYLASGNDESWDWRSDFISTYVERDIPLMGPRLPAVRLRQLWSMLAHYHAQQVNLSRLGESLGVNYKTVKNYIDTLTDFYMVRQVPPWAGNTKKRLVKAPKVYLRDSGLLHRLLNIADFDSLLGHPSAGPSWEGFVVENILTHLTDKWRYSYYRTSAQAEVDLVLEGPKRRVLAIEIKRSSAPVITKGFHLACEDIVPTERFLIYPGVERFPITRGAEAIGLIEFLQYISE